MENTNVPSGEILSDEERVELETQDSDEIRETPNLPAEIPQLFDDGRKRVAELETHLSKEARACLDLSYEELIKIPDTKLMNQVLLFLWQRAEMEKEYDNLTGLVNNKKRFLEISESSLSMLARSSMYPQAVVIAIDLNNFKSVNDKFGHSRGDQLLQEFAQTVKETLRKNDLPVRLGGDEFALLLPGIDANGAKFVIDRLVDALKPIFESDELKECNLGMAIGMQQIGGVDKVARDKQLGEAVSLALKQADIASYVAKQRSKRVKDLDSAPVLFRDGMVNPQSRS